MQVAQKIVSYFQDNFSDKIYKQQFINEIKTKAENIPIAFDIHPLCPVQISLNDPFSIKEMEVARGGLGHLFVLSSLNQNHFEAFVLMSIQRDILDAIGFKEILNIVKKSSSLMNQMLSA
ncbi:zinc finger MYM-type protein 1-like [Aphis craccivora]|uniref:Zinc finger MYM-type protein 1-like n=2 Tax=Aphis craccivora TaxID=307492 RepID=A0A6G0YZK3_APHCR|nr:zinc finger MYM-type protein 1-like [Aphis craccivora]